MTVQSTALKAVLAALAVRLKLDHSGAQSLPKGVELHLDGSWLPSLPSSSLIPGGHEPQVYQRKLIYPAQGS